MRKVFAVAGRGHDLSAAKEFGELQFLVPWLPNVFATDHMAAIMKERLSTSSKDDYLVPCGSLPLNCLAAATLALRHGRLNLLLWDDRGQVYVPRTITASQLCPPQENLR